jgi:serine/threonine-protein kinase
MQARLGRYVVLKHLASGGMADVLLGRTDGIEGFERHVVLKRIKPEHARDQRFIRMFLDEARVAANLHHQHIVQVHDIGEADGEYFIAMEYIHGEDVRSLLSAASKGRAHVPLGIAIAIVSSAAAGLHYAHERQGPDKRPLGIVHRDISPSNILAGYDGSIKILDFGIAKASSRPDTRSGNLKGKISYMSPEQFKATAVDRRSDVYSLGVVLYELATTTRLFKGESDYLVMEQIVNGRVSLPQVRRPDLPNELSAIIMRAIAPDPERRYFTADEFRVALEQFAAKSGLTASTSAIGAYMRKQFGERPEPWLELEAQGIYSFDDPNPLPVGSSDDSAPGSWTESRSEDRVRRSTGSIPRSARSSSPPSSTPFDDRARLSAPAIRPSSTPTDSKMGWESQKPPPAAFTPRKLALICAPLVLILGVLIWRLAGTGASESIIAATAPPAAPPAVAAPIVTPIPEPPRPAEPAAVAAAPGPTDTTAAPEPAPSGKSRSIASAAPGSPIKRSAPSTAKTVEVAPPSLPGAKSAGAAPGGVPGALDVAVPAVSVTGPTTSPLAALGAALTSPPAAAPIAPPPPIAAIQQAAPAARPAIAAPVVPQNVAPTLLDANRIAGDKDIVPDNGSQTEINRSGQDKVVGSYKLCVTTDGGVDSVSLLKSTGFPAYDAKIQNTIRSKWRYKPFVISGKAVPVCTAVMFVYLLQK